MAKQIINIGAVPNDKSGDTLRTAFRKVNDNFAELYNHVSAGVVASDVAPTSPGEGDLWWDTISGRLYVYYGTSWIDASPVDGVGNSSTNQLVNGVQTVSLGSNGTLQIPSAIYSPDELRVRIDGANDWIFYNGYLTLSNGAVIDDNARLGPAGLNILTLIDPTGYNTWNFGRDGNLTLPVGGAILDSTGTNILDGLSGGITISNFGEGFSLNGASKIVTNKLYSTNETQPTQHYRLTLDTNGVVHLPDESIINGATLKSVAGNYAGITAGPVGADEDSWMWVDSDGAWIATKYSTDAFQWHFDNSGNTTFPNGAKLNNGTAFQFATDNTVTTSLDLRDATGRGFYTNTDGFSLRGNGSNTWKFGTDGDITLPGGGKIVTTGGAIDIQAGASSDWAELLSHSGQNAVWVDDSGAYVAIAGVSQWTFGTDNFIQFPGGGPTTLGIKNINGSQKFQFNISGPQIQSATGKTWTFGADGRTILPTSGVPTHSYGATGDKAGMVAFDSNYIYYCKQDYVDNMTNIWVRVVWTDTNW